MTRFELGLTVIGVAAGIVVAAAIGALLLGSMPPIWPTAVAAVLVDLILIYFFPNWHRGGGGA